MFGMLSPCPLPCDKWQQMKSLAHQTPSRRHRQWIITEHSLNFVSFLFVDIQMHGVINYVERINASSMIHDIVWWWLKQTSDAHTHTHTHRSIEIELYLLWSIGDPTSEFAKTANKFNWSIGMKECRRITRKKREKNIVGEKECTLWQKFATRDWQFKCRYWMKDALE